MATIQGVYLALFGRPADPAGLAFFNAATNNGADLTAIGDLAATDEYQDRFTGLSNEEIIDSIYQSLFGRDAEAGGRVFFANALATGELNINNIAIAILDGAQNEDLVTVNAKIAAANLFTARLDLQEERDAYVGDFAAQVGRDYIAAVDGDDSATSDEADAAILRLFDPDQGQGPGEQPGPNPGGNFSPIAAADSFSVDEDDVLNGSVLDNDTDAEGSPLTATLGQDVSNGSLTFNADGTFTYTPDENFNGVDSFTYRANDGQFNSNEVTVTITVDAQPETYDLEPNSTLNVAFNASEDRLTIDDADVSDTGAPTLVSLTADPVDYGFGNATYNLSGAATGSNAVVELSNDFSAAFSGTVNSADLFNALRDDSFFFGQGSVNGINVGQDNWEGYLVAYADNNAYVFYGDSGANSTLSAGEITLVGTLTGVAAGELTQANFIAG